MNVNKHTQKLPANISISKKKNH